MNHPTYRELKEAMMSEIQLCGHPITSVASSDEGTHFCLECARAADHAELVSLRARHARLLDAAKAALHEPEYDGDNNPSPCSCQTCTTLRAAIAESEQQ